MTRPGNPIREADATKAIDKITKLKAENKLLSREAGTLQANQRYRRGAEEPVLRQDGGTIREEDLRHQAGSRHC